MNKARQKKIIVNFLRSPIYNKESSEPLNFDNSIYVQIIIAVIEYNIQHLAMAGIL